MNIRHYPTPKPLVMSGVLKDMFQKAEIPFKDPDALEEATWEEIRAIDLELAKGIVEITASMRGAVVKLEASGRQTPAEKEEMDALVRTAVSDVHKFTSDIIKLRETYADKSGVASSEDDLVGCYAMAQSYSTLNDRFRGALFPVIISLTEQLSDMGQSIRKEMEAQDISVVTDVEVKALVPATDLPAASV